MEFSVAIYLLSSTVPIAAHSLARKARVCEILVKLTGVG
jgi:hypothetical protein